MGAEKKLYWKSRFRNWEIGYKFASQIQKWVLANSLYLVLIFHSLLRPLRDEGCVQCPTPGLRRTACMGKTTKNFWSPTWSRAPCLRIPTSLPTLLHSAWMERWTATLLAPAVARRWWARSKCEQVVKGGTDLFFSSPANRRLRDQVGARQHPVPRGAVGGGGLEQGRCQPGQVGQYHHHR